MPTFVYAIIAFFHLGTHIYFYLSISINYNMHFLNVEYLMCTISDLSSFTTLNVLIIIKDMYMISIGLVRTVLDTFARPTDS